MFQLRSSKEKEKRGRKQNQRHLSSLVEIVAYSRDSRPSFQRVPRTDILSRNLSQSPKLWIFDISKNNFNGVLPSDYFAGWSAMSLPVVYFEGDSQYRFSGVGKLYYRASVALRNKGSNMKLVGSGFTIYKTIDISGNRFQGGIPESIGLLNELIVLNISNNAFTGRIPQFLSSITGLQSLDLSQNRLSGKIPPELGKLTFLAWMNFSYSRLRSNTTRHSDSI
ncbi:receptor like protein 48 [Raphanus sativus]|nr:receptor like protein 48 [Raphanus sativus]